MHDARHSSGAFYKAGTFSSKFSADARARARPTAWLGRRALSKGFRVLGLEAPMVPSTGFIRFRNNGDCRVLECIKQL